MHVFTARAATPNLFFTDGKTLSTLFMIGGVHVLPIGPAIPEKTGIWSLLKTIFSGNPALHGPNSYPFRLQMDDSARIRRFAGMIP